MGRADSMTKTQAAFEPPRPPLPPPSTERLNLDETGRLMLATTSQVNAISVGLKNSNDICGGAVVVAALVLRSTSPEAARANAGALRAAFNASPAKALTPVGAQSGVSTALKNFEAGTLSEEDVCYLQQAAYIVGRGVSGEAKSPGLSTGAMASMVADLVGYGATIDTETSFAQVFDGANGHWVGATAGQSLNTAEAITDAGKVDFAKLKLDSREFSGRVRILKDKVGAHVIQVQSRYGPNEKTGALEVAKKGAGWQAEITPHNPSDALISKLAGSNSERLRNAFRPTTQLRD